MSSPDPAQDQLVALLRSGDEQAFRSIVRRYGPTMRAMARIFCSDDAAAEEVVQETWFAVVEGLDGFEGRASLKTWVLGILKNQARTRSRRDARVRAWSSVFEATMDEQLTEDVMAGRFDARGHWMHPPSSWALDPEQRLVRRDILAVIRRAIEALPASQQAVVRLRDVEGVASEEVCELLELSAGNQRVLLHRGRTRVRAAVEAYLSEHGEEAP